MELRNDFLFKTFSESRLPELEYLYGKNRKYAVVGAGQKGKWTLRSLRHAGYNVVCFIDNDKQKQGKLYGSEGGGGEIPVISFSGFVRNNEEIIAVIANDGYASEYIKVLRELRYPMNNIYYHHGDVLINIFGDEYFDVYKHKSGEKEIFLDIGAMDGNTTKSFINWCSGEYEKVYVIEASKEMYEIPKLNLKDYSNIEYLNVAVSDHSGKQNFTFNTIDPEGSRINNDEQGELVNCVSIDEILNGESCTFIKMDIEGAEEKALLGAKETIKKYKPFFAISAYHLETDLIKLPQLIKQINPTYKLYLRHYSNMVYDVVLYAI